MEMGMGMESVTGDAALGVDIKVNI